MQYTLTIHGKAITSAAYVKDQCSSNRLRGLAILACAWLDTPMCGGCVIESDETAAEARHRMAVATTEDDGGYWLGPVGHPASEILRLRKEWQVPS